MITVELFVVAFAAASTLIPPLLMSMSGSCQSVRLAFIVRAVTCYRFTVQETPN